MIYNINNDFVKYEVVGFMQVMIFVNKEYLC